MDMFDGLVEVGVAVGVVMVVARSNWLVTMVMVVTPVAAEFQHLICIPLLLGDPTYFHASFQLTLIDGLAAVVEAAVVAVVMVVARNTWLVIMVMVVTTVASSMLVVMVDLVDGHRMVVLVQT